MAPAPQQPSSMPHRHKSRVPKALQPLEHILQHEKNFLPIDLEHIFANLITHTSGTQCTVPHAGKASTCACGLVPLLTHKLEKLRPEHFRDISDIWVWDLHKALPTLAAALLKGGHTMRAFRRVTEAWEM